MKDTDFVSRSFAFVADEARPILIGMVPWLSPVLMLVLWPLVNPEGFAGQAQRALLNLEATGRFEAGPTTLQWAFIVFSSLLPMVMIAGFAASQHRRVLEPVTPLGRTLPEAVLPYTAYWLLAVVAIAVLWMLYWFVIGLVAAQIPWWLFWPLAIAGAFLMGMIAMRAILVFPAIAVGDRSMTVERSFSLTRQAVWRMLQGVLLIVLILLLLYFGFGVALNFFLMFASDAVKIILLTIIQLVLEFVSTAVFVTYVSLTYAHLTGREIPKPTSW